MSNNPIEDDDDTADAINEPRLWRDNGWTARVIKNNDDDGWAVEMIRQGEPEPAWVGPWTMGRDKKNPKPLDTSAFNTLVKTAAEVVRRHEQHLHAMLHKQVEVHTGRQAASASRSTSCPTTTTRTRCWPQLTAMACSRRNCAWQRISGSTPPVPRRGSTPPIASPAERRPDAPRPA